MKTSSVAMMPTCTVDTCCSNQHSGSFYMLTLIKTYTWYQIYTENMYGEQIQQTYVIWTIEEGPIWYLTSHLPVLEIVIQDTYGMEVQFK